MESFISIEGKRKEYTAYEETTDYVITAAPTTCTIKRATSGSSIASGSTVYVTYATGIETYHEPVVLTGTTAVSLAHQSETVDTNSIFVESLDVNDQRLVSVEEGLFIPQVDDFNDRFSATSTIVSYSEHNKSIKSYRDGSIKTKDQEDYYMETYFPGGSSRKRLKSGFSLPPDVIGKSAINTKFATIIIRNEEGFAIGEADTISATEVFTDV
jgi:hypothetical protein